MHHGLSPARWTSLATLVAALILAPCLAAAESLSIRWDANPEQEVVGYMVYVGNVPGQYTTTVDVGRTTQYTFDGAVPGQRYCFSVAAYFSGPVVGARSTEVCTLNDQPPTLVNPGDQTNQVGAPVSLTLTGSDPDGLPVTYSASGLPPGLSITSSTGSIGGTPTTVGTFSTTATVSDGTFSTSQSFQWTIQAALPGAANPLRPSGAISTATPTFEWESVVSATSYRLWVDDASTTDPKIQVDVTPAQAGCTTTGAICHVTASTALAAGRASWSVRASNASGAGPWSGALDFTVPDGAAPTVVISAPTAAATYSTGNSSISLGGTASDDVAVTQVTWSNNAGGSGVATGTSTWSVASVPLVSGTNVITVTARDGAGNIATDVLTVTKSDGQAPTLDITAPTSGTSYSSTTSSITLGGATSDDVLVTRVTWSNDRGGSGTATVTSGMGFMSGGAGGQTWNVLSIALQPGANVITVTAFDAAGNQSSKALTVTLADTVAPTVAIATPTAAASYSTTSETIALSGAAADAVGVTQVAWANSQGGSGIAAGTTGWSVASLALKPGANVITVTARDAAGNTGTATLTVTMTDGAAPSIAIATPTAANTYSTSAATLAVGGTASDAFGVTQVTWSTDKGAQGVATGTTAWSVAGIPLAVGANTITVSAIDAAGHTGTDVLTVTRTDGVAPAVDITAPAAGATFSTTSTTIALGGSASDNVGVVQVTWANDKGGSGAATGTTTWSVAGVTLRPGANVITVTARDAAGNVATDVLTVTLTDAVAPEIAIASPTTADTFKTTSATIALAGTASDSFGVTEVRWSNDRGGSGVAAGTTSWSVPAIALQQGVNVVTVTARDAAGNTSSDRITVTADSKAPVLTILAPAANTVTKGETVAVNGTASDEVGVAEVSWSNNRGGSGQASGTAAWSIASLPLQSGVNVITVTARDAAGNATIATVSVTRDSVAPSVSIVAPTSAATFVTNKASLGLTGKASDNTGVTQVTWQNSRGGAGTAVGTGDWNAGAVALQAGANVIAVTARDAAGNTTTSTLTVTLDTRAPSISIQAPTGANTYQTTSSRVTIGGVATDDSGVVEVTWTNNQGGAGSASGTATWTAASIPLHAGFNDITITARDAAGNTSSESLKVKATDKTAPQVRITGPSMDSTASVSVGVINLEGTATDDFEVAQIAWANDRGGSGVVRPGARWVAGGVVLQPGVNVLAVTAVDAAGNSSSAQIRISYDRGLPTLTITSPSATGAFASSTASVAVTGTAADDSGVAQVTWSTDKGQNGVATGTTAWSIPSVSVDPAGTVLTVTATDRSGNSARATMTLTRLDATAPVVKIFTPTTAFAYSTTASSIVLGGTASDDLGVTQVTWASATGAAGTAFGTTGWSTPSIPLAVGSNAIVIAARDAAGNQASATLTVTRTATSPSTLTTSPAGLSSDPNVSVTSKPQQPAIAPLQPGTAPQPTPAPAATVSTAAAAVTAMPLPTPPLAPANTAGPASTPSPKTPARTSENRSSDAKEKPVAPVIRILAPTAANRLTVTGSAITLAGSASHPSGIVLVKWSTDAGDSGSAEGTAKWSAPNVPLKVGTTTITVTAVSSSGEMATAAVVVTRPDELPRLTLIAPVTQSQWTSATSSLTLRGSATENVTRVTWSSESGAGGTASGTSAWAIAGITLQEGANRITVTAQDAAGRTDRHVFTVIYQPQQARR